MMRYLKTEWIKERRAANAQLVYLVPIVFVVFNVLMVSLMGESPAGKSYLMATSFNWYPILILPIVLSLLVVNIIGKEKTEHLDLYRRQNVSMVGLLLSKQLMVIAELLLIFVLSSLAVYAVGRLMFHEVIFLSMLALATLCLFIGSLPIVALSFLLMKVIQKKIPVILINFICTFPAALIAPTSKWFFFPWCYNLRILSPVVGVHPNGTFLETGSPLLHLEATYLGLVLSLLVFLLTILLTVVIERRFSHA
ncbi:ABC transporter permease [Streptococcus marmotae]|uniref:ABC transporter permease n=1 Tax=Streptococcus marmotae TaxID=1825069 RepID=UPI00082EA061|nr:ABC transporter permease [Streptococcus marmotae]